MSYSPCAKSTSSLYDIVSPKKSKYFKESKSILHEIYLILKLSLPIGIAILSEWIPVYAGNAVLGHLPNAELILSGAGLARTFNNVTGASLAWAFTQGLFTLIPQAIGRNRMDLLSLYFQRAAVVCLVIALPLSILQLFGAKFFILIGEPKDIEDIIYNCCKWGIGNIFALNLVSLLQKLGQSFNYQFQLLFISLFCALIAYPLALFLIKPEYANLGYIGCPITVFLLNFVNSFCIIILLCYKGHSSLFKYYGSQIFKWKQIKTYVKLCIPALFTNSLEWWIIEITTALAGYIINPDIALSSNIIVGNIQTFTVLLALGNSAAASIRIGKYVGMERINKAKESHNAAFMVSMIYSVIMIVFIYIFIDKIPLIFTNEGQVEIVNTTIYGLYIILFGIIFQNIMQVLGGVYRGIGKQMYAAMFISGSYYVVGLTLTLSLLFGGGLREDLVLGICSIWIGWAVANLCGSCLLECYYSCFVDWNKVLIDINKRIDNEVYVDNDDDNIPIIKTPKFSDYYGSVNSPKSS